METLSAFTARFQGERTFQQHQEAIVLFSELQSKYLTPSWLPLATDSQKHIVFKCLRLLLRDDILLNEFVAKLSTLITLSEELKSMTHKYLMSLDRECNTLSLIITEMTNIMQKVTHCISSHSILLEYDTHKQLLFLLEANHYQILQSSMNALINLSKTPSGREAVLECYPLNVILHIMSTYDQSSQFLGGDLFLLLSQECNAQNQIKEQDLLCPCLSLIQSNLYPLYVKQRILESLDWLLDDQDLVNDFRALGGIPVLMVLIHPKLSNGGPEYCKVLNACFTLLTRLSLNDVCAKQIVDCNGLYLLTYYLVATETASNEQNRNLQKYCLRTLRFLFSLERNRRLIKLLFPIHIFEDFINIGHYVHNLSAYSKLVDSLELLSPEEKLTLKINQKSLNQSNDPLNTIGEFDVLELLGTGAYGSVYKVRKGPRGSLYALKEIQANHPALGTFKTPQERSENIGRIMSEVAMIHEKLQHPNIVRYYKCFEESQHVYILMSLIGGAPLSEFITSMKEKMKQFTEERIWNIFSQITCALRYLHEDKRIVHRDLKPANMILGDQDKVTITDFGLAKHHKEFSVMKSTVGTMIYWCPELVENEHYDKKADIWASGCILYELAVLEPPFYAGNMLALAKKIAEVDFDERPLQQYSLQVRDVVCNCLVADPLKRPDSIQIAGMIANHLMKQLDNTTSQCILLENKALKERAQTRRQIQESITSAEQRNYFSVKSSKREMSFDSINLSDCQSSTLLPSSLATVSSKHHRLSFDRTLRITQGSGLDSVLSDPSERETSILSRQRSYSLSPVSPHKRDTSGSSLLSISPRHLREIADPVGDLLRQLHKLIYISQLPPHKQTSSACYSIVIRYKRALFCESSQKENLKTELHQLSISSNQEVSLLPPLPHLLLAALSELSESSTQENHVTYEHLNLFIEHVLKQTDYYNTSST